MDRIEPDWEPHSKLEKDVKSFLEGHGYITCELTYHSKLSREIANILSGKWDFTALYLRGRADRIAVHKGNFPTFEWEAKTHSSTKMHDITIEALPLAHHIKKDELGVECLYIYRSPYDNRDYGWWTSDLPEISTIYFPRNKFYRTIEVTIKTYLATTFNITDIRSIPRTTGSGDPFVVIKENEKLKLKDWRDLINERTEQVDTS